jgi:hypothetical protein
VVVGVERYLAFYQEMTRDPDAIVGFVCGSYDQPQPSALGKLVWPVFQAGATLKRTRALVRLDEAVSANRHASGIDQVWRAAFEKRCQAVLVETGFEHPADLSAEGDRLLPYSGQGVAALDDAVDDVIENVLAGGGEAFFYEPGALDLISESRQCSATERIHASPLHTASTRRVDFRVLSHRVINCRRDFAM